MMKKTIFSILGTFMFAALFIMNLYFFNENQNNKSETFNLAVTTNSAKAMQFYGDMKKRFLRPGCKPALGYVCCFDLERIQ